MAQVVKIDDIGMEKESNIINIDDIGSIDVAPPQQVQPMISGGNAFMKALDVLNTPQQMIFGGVKGAIEGKPILGSAMEGARKNTSFGEILGAVGIPSGPSITEMAGTKIPIVGDVTPRATAGLLGDIVLDPVNLIPLGAISKGARKISEATGLTRTVSKFIPQISESEKAVKALIKMEENALQARKYRALLAGKKFKGRIQSLAKKTGIPEEELGQRIGVQVEKRSDAGIAAALRKSGVTDFNAAENIATDVDSIKAGLRSMKEAPDDLAEIVDEAVRMKKALNDNLLAEKATGLGTIELDDTSVDYMTHLLTKEAKETVIKSKEMRTLGLKYNARHGFQLARKYRGLSVDDINRLAAAGKLPGYEGQIIPKFFEDNPALVQTVRLLRGEKAMSDARIYTKSAEQLGKSVFDPVIADILKEDPTRFVKLKIAGQQADRRVQELAVKMKDFVFEPDVAKHLDAYYEAAIAPQAIGKNIGQAVATGDMAAFGKNFLSIYDEVQGWWKKLTLMPFPAYHFRNAIGNVWNNGLAGIWNPAEYKRAVDFLHMEPDKIVQLGQKQFTKQALDDLLIDYGIGGQFKKYMALPEDLTKIELSTARNPVALGMKIGEAIEDNARITHFFSRLESGMNPAQAALSVKKYLFDYNDLGAIEKAVLRRIMPFYSWTRFNIPLQFKSLVDKPQQFNALGDIINSVSRDRPAPSDTDKLMASWMAQNSPVQTRNDSEGNPEYLLLGGWIPAADMNKMTDPLNAAIDMMGPLIKAPIEGLTNKSIYFNEEIERYPGEKEKFLGLPMRKAFSNTLRNIRLLSELDRAIASGGKALFGMELTTRYGEEPVPFFVRSLFGAKLYPVEIAKRRRRLMRERQDLIRQRSFEVRQGRGYNVAPINELIERKSP